MSYPVGPHTDPPVLLAMQHLTALYRDEMVPVGYSLYGNLPTRVRLSLVSAALSLLGLEPAP